MQASGNRTFREHDKLALALLLRGNDKNLDIADSLRSDEKEKDEKRIGKIGEIKTVPLIVTNLEGVGSVSYVTTSFEVTSNSVRAEKRSVSGSGISGFAAINE